MKGQYLLRLSLTYAMLGSGVAVLLLLAVMLKAAADETLGRDPRQMALIFLFLVAFAAFGTANAVLYRRVARKKNLRAGSEDS